MDDTDLAARLDRSIGPAPDHEPPLVELLASGHRVVRRRRVAAALASAAAVVVAVGGVALTTGGEPDTATPPVAGDPTASPSPTVAPRTVAALYQEFPEAGRMADLDLDAVVVERLDDPLDLPPPGHSVAAAVTDGDGTIYWVLLFDRGRGRAGGAVTEAAQEKGTFSHWIAQQPIARSLRGEEPGQPTDFLVRFADTGESLAPLEGVTILEQRAGVDVGASFAGPADDTVAALVRDAAGDLRYVLARRGPGVEPEFIAVTQAEGGPDLDAFLLYARERYAEGGGGLL